MLQAGAIGILGNPAQTYLVGRAWHAIHSTAFQHQQGVMVPNSQYLEDYPPEANNLQARL